MTRKHLGYYIAAPVIAAMIATGAFIAFAKPAGSSNLLRNASVESTQDDTTPQYWKTSKWGDNDGAMVYKNEGHSGNKSLYVSMSRHVDGDAKWVAEPITATPSTRYTYGNYYKASTSTDIVVRYTDESGTINHMYVTSAPASPEWRQLTASFTTPENATSLSVMHVLTRPGFLQTDDFSLVASKVTSTGLLPNGSFEDAESGTKPVDWSESSWGNNSAKFEYLSTGRSNSRSVKVSVSDYVDGDAKWLFKPITTLKPGAEYRYTTWYKTNTAPKVTVMLQSADGNTSYNDMPIPFPAKDSDMQWQKYTSTFTVPHDTTAVSVFMLVRSNGWLELDDQSIEPYKPVGFDRPLVSLTFDDSQKDNVTTVLPVVKRYNYKITQCFATQYIEGKKQQIDNVMQFHKGGHEVCAHSITHPFMTSLAPGALDRELKHPQEYLRQLTGQPVSSFATPYGDYNEKLNKQAKIYYDIHRTVDAGFNSKDNLNKYRLRVQNITPNTTVDQYKAWLAQAEADNTWLIFVYHRVAGNPGPFDTTPAEFKKQMKALKDSGITVKTMKDGLAETKAQL